MLARDADHDSSSDDGTDLASERTSAGGDSGSFHSASEGEEAWSEEELSGSSAGSDNEELRIRGCDCCAISESEPSMGTVGLRAQARRVRARMRPSQSLTLWPCFARLASLPEKTKQTMQ